MRIAINGFGRIGKTIVRQFFQNRTQYKSLEIVAINDPNMNAQLIAHLFTYDSSYGTFQGTVTYTQNELQINGKTISLFFEPDATKLPWSALAIDTVIEASGALKTKKELETHQAAGCTYLLISAPSPHAHITIIPEINNYQFDARHHTIISLGSCTSNAVAPLIQVLHKNFIIESALITTIHAYTNDQNLLDSAHKDLGRARAAALNIIPTKTGADQVITQLFPDLCGKIQALALRVPVPTVSLIDMTVTTQKEINRTDINQAFLEAATNNLRTILQYIDCPLVSNDFKGNPASAIFDANLTHATPHQGKIFAWYDNEVGYSQRVLDFALQIFKDYSTLCNS